MFLLPSQVPFFQGLSNPELVALIDELPFRKFPKGLIIMEEGEASNEIYVILRGSVDVLKRDASGHVHQTINLTVGSLFGEFSYFTGSPRTHSVLAHEESVLLEMSVEWIAHATRQFPELAQRLQDLYRSRTLVPILKSTRLFSTLTQEELIKLGERFEFKHIEAGQTLIHEGAKENHLMIIKSGTVSITKQQGGQHLQLATLGTGEVLGEMALVTGEPRSASATALSSCEYMLLSQEACREVFREFPKVLEIIKGMIELRSLQNQQILESFSEQVFSTESPLDGNDGLWVKDLHLRVTFDDKSTQTKSFPVVRISSDYCVLETDQWFDSAHMKFEEPKQKLLKDLAKLPAISIRTQRSEVGTIMAVFQSLDPDTPAIHAFLPKLAQAKLKGLVYPEYDASIANISVRLKRRTGDLFAKLISASVTNGKIGLHEAWPVGDLAQTHFLQDNTILLDAKTLSLGQQGELAEFQFEYETPAQKESIERLIHTLSKGITQVSTSKPSSKNLQIPQNSPLLTRRFSSTHEFVRTYLSSIDAGMIKVSHQGALATGAAVRVHLVIPYENQKGERKISCQGVIKQQRDGVALVTLDDSQFQLRQRLEKICRESVEQKSNDSWEERKNELLGITQIATATQLPHRIKWAILTLTLILMVLAYTYAYLNYFNSGLETQSPWVFP